MISLVNGKPGDMLATRDRGVQYGDGVFETIAMQDGMPLFWERHMERLVAGCLALGFPAPDRKQLREETAAVAGAAARSVVKIIVTRGVGVRGYRPDREAVPTRIVHGSAWPAHPEDADRSGVAVRWCAMRLARQPRLAGLKHLNRLEQVLARAEWQNDHAEGLMCDTEGLVIEGTMSNLFLVVRDTLITPDLSQSGVAGVVRGVMLDEARRLGLQCAVQAVTPAMVEQADELFLTNSLIGVWPVSRLEARRYEVVGKTTQALQAALQLAPDRLV